MPDHKFNVTSARASTSLPAVSAHQHLSWAGEYDHCAGLDDAVKRDHSCGYSANTKPRAPFANSQRSQCVGKTVGFVIQLAIRKPRPSK